MVHPVLLYIYFYGGGGIAQTRQSLFICEKLHSICLLRVNYTLKSIAIRGKLFDSSGTKFDCSCCELSFRSEVAKPRPKFPAGSAVLPLETWISVVLNENVGLPAPVPGGGDKRTSMLEVDRGRAGLRERAMGARGVHGASAGGPSVV